MVECGSNGEGLRCHVPYTHVKAEAPNICKSVIAASGSIMTP